MNKKIYAIVEKKANGPQGHGEPGEAYVALCHDGMFGSIGKIHPLFTTEAAAEEYKSTIDKYDMCKVIELILVEKN